MTGIRTPPEDKAREMIALHGAALAMDAAWRWQKVYGGQGSEATAYWSLVVTHLRVMARNPGKPHTKAQKRRLRERRLQQQEARA
jgi:hypothetical protein